MAALGPLSFLSPLILLALGTLPLIWWLLRTTPPAPDRVRFPAFIILRRLINVKETPDKTPWWLIALRLLLAAAVIIGLAGPMLNAPEIDDAGGPLVLVVDNSYAAAPGWSLRRTLIEQAAEQVRQTGRAAFVLTTAPTLASPAERITGSLNAAQLRSLAGEVEPQPFAADRRGAIETLQALDTILARQSDKRPAAIWWLSDGLASPAQTDGQTDGQTDDQENGNRDTAFLAALSQRGDVSVYTDPTTPLFAIARSAPASPQDGQQNLSNVPFTVRRRDGSSPWLGTLVANARDGRELDRQAFAFTAGQTRTDITIELPLALQNDLASVRIDTARSAASLWLADARDRRALIGLINSDREASAALLSGNHYVRQAMAPFAAFQSGDITALTEARVSAIVLDDVGRLRADEEAALRAWLTQGGVLIRFSGPRLGDAALDGTPPLLPVRLRRGERALGGTLTWGTPQPIGSFSANGPFHDFSPPADVLIRQQVLAEPGGETSDRTWASLADGTPLITGMREGNGLIVLFHTSATPLWSDLPISETFVEMLKKITFLSTLSPKALEDSRADETRGAVRYPPLRLLDGYGQLSTPLSSALPVTLAQSLQTPSPQSPPGLYGAPDAPLAINATTAATPLSPLRLPGASVQPYTTNPPRQLWALFFTLALLALLIDLLATLLLKGLLGRRAAKPSPATNASLISIALLSILTVDLMRTPTSAHAQTEPPATTTPSGRPLDLPIDPKTLAATLTTRFAYVRSGNGDTNRIAELGLSALSQELSRRTTVSPALPVAIDLSKDDFSIYPIIYWPIEPGMEAISDATLAEVETFMQLGGLIIFDTRDDERSVDGSETPEAATLRQILTRIDTPPLVRLPRDHVLTRSYYLLPDLRGRNSVRPVWVAAGSATNDGVTPLIIGGRDWIGAWARSPDGTPLRPMVSDQVSAGERARELAYRAGINIAMVAFTGNYKTDQVHADVLLRRLGE